MANNKAKGQGAQQEVASIQTSPPSKLFGLPSRCQAFARFELIGGMVSVFVKAYEAGQSMPTKPTTRRPVSRSNLTLHTYLFSPERPSMATYSASSPVFFLRTEPAGFAGSGTF